MPSRAQVYGCSWCSHYAVPFANLSPRGDGDEDGSEDHIPPLRPRLLGDEDEKCFRVLGLREIVPLSRPRATDTILVRPKGVYTGEGRGKCIFTPCEASTAPLKALPGAQIRGLADGQKDEFYSDAHARPDGMAPLALQPSLEASRGSSGPSSGSGSSEEVNLQHASLLRVSFTPEDLNREFDEALEWLLPEYAAEVRNTIEAFFGGKAA